MVIFTDVGLPGAVVHFWIHPLEAMMICQRFRKRRNPRNTIKGLRRMIRRLSRLTLLKVTQARGMVKQGQPGGAALSLSKIL